MKSRYNKVIKFMEDSVCVDSDYKDMGDDPADVKGDKLGSSGKTDNVVVDGDTIDIKQYTNALLLDDLYALKDTVSNYNVNKPLAYYMDKSGVFEFLRNTTDCELTVDSFSNFDDNQKETKELSKYLTKAIKRIEN